MWKTAKVAVEKAAYHFDKLYDYLIPAPLEASLQPGCRVLVPFGGGNRKRQGMVFRLEQQEQPPEQQLKSISEQLDEAPLLTEEQLRLAVYLKTNTFCCWYEAAKLMIPSGIGMKLKVFYTPSAAFSMDELLAAASAKGEPHRRLMDLLCGDYPHGLPREKLWELLRLPPDKEEPAPLRALRQAGLVELREEARQKIQDETVTMVRLTGKSQLTKLTPKQRKAVEFLEENQPASVKEVTYLCGITRQVLQNLAKLGAVEFFENAVYRNPYPDAAQKAGQQPVAVLTPQQRQAADQLFRQWNRGEASVSLLYGVTGSGKTEVYLWLIDRVLAAGKNVIVMVPEIALTPQTLDKFHRRYGETVAVLHSGLTLSQRMDEWKRMKEGQVRIAVGTRSAVFAPLENIGLIVMDEEQEHTYKSEAAPRFHAREAAKFRCVWHKALLLLCSATPSLESYFFARQGKYQLVALPSRYSGASLPPVQLVDMSSQPGAAETGFSKPLLEALADNLDQGRQSILLLNRRGHSTVVTCSQCQQVVSCPNCSISLTYHAKNGQLICHYCGYTREAVTHCDQCGSEYVRYTGQGTQKAEQQLQILLPKARILRMDADTTLTRFSHQTYFDAFARGEYDIMIGTQMVAKGLNFPDVTLVGVLAADSYLYSDDFRSYERTFDLLTQVVGRGGRGAAQGRAIIQTYSPDNDVILHAAHQNFEGFYQGEIAARKLLTYPPFCDMGVVGFSGERQPEVLRAANRFLELIRQTAAQYPDIPLQVMGPCESSVLRVNNKYRYKLLFKYKNSRPFRELMARLLRQFGALGEARGVTYYADPYFDGSL